MKNAYFDDNDLNIMLSGKHLKIVSSAKSDVPASKPGGEYLDWLNKNCDWHDYREAMLVLSGNSYFSLNGITYPCLPGTFFLIDSKEKHDSFYPPFYDNFQHLWFRIIGRTIFANIIYSKINGIVKNKNFNCIFNEYNHAGQLFINAWDRLTSETTTDRAFDWIYLKNAVTGILFEACRVDNDVLSGKNAAPTELHHKTVINAVTKHIKETGGRNLNIDKLAYLAGYSKFHFARLFKEFTGLSVLKFINSAKMDKYKELSKKGLNKKQIAYKLGFSSPSAFSRWLNDNLTR